MGLEGVVSVAARPKPASAAAAAVWIDLTDGSMLLARQYTVRQGTARIVLLGGQVLELPSGEVAAVRFQAGSEAMAAQWSRIAGLDLGSDALVVTKQEGMDYHRGVLHDVTERDVRFELEGQLLTVKRSKVYGVVYYHSAAERPAEGSALVLDADGSRWSARSVAFSGRWEWTTAGGHVVGRDAEQVAAVDLSRGKIVYLSDLRPERDLYAPVRHGEGVARGWPSSARGKTRTWNPGRLPWGARRFPRGCVCTAAPRWSTGCRAASAVSRPWRGSTTKPVPAATCGW